MASETGSKWIIMLSIYFLFLTGLVTMITYIDGGEINTGLGITEPNFCSAPRSIYEPYEYYPIFDTFNIPSNLKYETIYEADLDCSLTRGVRSETDCLNYEGCTWEAPSGFLFWSWGNATCTGNINASYYGIDTYTPLLSSSSYVASHNNSRISFYTGSICTHPEVIYDSDLCNLFSCVWYEDTDITNLEFNSDELDGSVGSTRKVFKSLGDLFAFKFDWGIENNLFNVILIFFTFHLPLIALAFAIYMIIRN